LKIWSFDTETHRKRAGLISPPLVCGSIATREPGSERLLDKAQARQFFSNTIADPDVHIVGANIAFDLGVMAADNPRLIEPIFAALDAGRLHDVAIREALIDIAKGLHGVDPTTGRKLDDDEGARYPLALLVKRYFGVDISEDKKIPNERHAVGGDVTGRQQIRDEQLALPSPRAPLHPVGIGTVRAAPVSRRRVSR
jgi:DNA polymerase-1